MRVRCTGASPRDQRKSRLPRSKSDTTFYVRMSSDRRRERNRCGPKGSRRVCSCLNSRRSSAPTGWALATSEKTTPSVSRAETGPPRGSKVGKRERPRSDERGLSNQEPGSVLLSQEGERRSPHSGEAKHCFARSERPSPTRRGPDSGRSEEPHTLNKRGVYPPKRKAAIQG